MTAETSPRPWRFVDPFDDGFPVVRDANECQVATLDGATPDLNEANAELVVAAVNERDRLRDIVREAVETLNQIYKHADMTDALREVVVETQREARAAIGEDASP